jgi:hypothetical protein
MQAAIPLRASISGEILVRFSQTAKTAYEVIPLPDGSLIFRRVAAPPPARRIKPAGP